MKQYRKATVIRQLVPRAQTFDERLLRRHNQLGIVEQLRWKLN